MFFFWKFVLLRNTAVAEGSKCSNWQIIIIAFKQPDELQYLLCS